MKMQQDDVDNLSIERLQEDVAALRQCLDELIRIAETLSGWEQNELDFLRYAKALCGYDS